MTFKRNWEKKEKQVEISPQSVTEIMKKIFPVHRLLSQHIIWEGYSNLNIKILLENGYFVVRVYLRDPDAVYKEWRIINFVRKWGIPVTVFFHMGDYVEEGRSYRVALTEEIRGIPLRDLLLCYPVEEWQEVMVDVGAMLSVFQNLSFPQAGVLRAGRHDDNLDVVTPFQPDDLVNFVMDCLQNSQVREALGESMVNQIKEIFQTQSAHFPDESHPCLVHGDFDPSNILVYQSNGKWHVSGVMDWEFAFSGSWLWDVANMLRYAHQMPSTYEESFLKGLEKGGLTLPENWRITIALLNISSLLDILARHPIQERPRMKQDVCDLIAEMVKRVCRYHTKNQLRLV